MKLKLELDPTKHEDVQEADRILNYLSYQIILCSTLDKLRNIIKYEDRAPEAQAMAEEIQAYLYEMVQDYKLDLD